MRIDGFSSQSYPIKRKPRKGQRGGRRVRRYRRRAGLPIEEQLAARAAKAPAQRLSNLPARQQDMIFHRAMSKSVAMALASYLTTAGFVDWDMEVLGLDLHI